MRRASASDSTPSEAADAPLRLRLLARRAVGCALVVGLTAGASTAARAAGADDDAGRLDLNANVLVNESVGAGTAGDFAIRGRLFSQELTVRAHERAEARSERLSVAGALTFVPKDSTADGYQAVRGALFEEYTSTTRTDAREVRQESSIVSLLLLVIGVPGVLLGGVSLGRFWARRKRASA